MSSSPAVSAQARKALGLAVQRLKTAERPHKGAPLRVGVDLGTASIIVVVIGDDGLPLATELQVAQVARDGLVVDYMGAIDIVRRLVGNLNRRLGTELETAAIAMPPGVHPSAGQAHRHVVEAAGLDVTNVVDEPTAAGTLLGVRDGVVVDIGGGTTGLSVFKDGQVTYVADEPTGGTHMALVLMGHYGVTFEQAEAMKQDPKQQADVRVAVGPVIEKMATIVQDHLRGRDATGPIYLVGGTSELPGIEKVFTSVLGIEAVVPPHAMMVTPLGIALNDTGKD